MSSSTSQAHDGTRRHHLNVDLNVSASALPGVWTHPTAERQTLVQHALALFGCSRRGLTVSISSEDNHAATSKQLIKSTFAS